MLRTAVPPIQSAHGRKVITLRRLGKRIAFGFEDDFWLVLHLMIAGRLRWRDAGMKLVGKHSLAAFDFPDGTLLLTEAGTKKRASLHLVRGEEALRAQDPGGSARLHARRVCANAVEPQSHTQARAHRPPPVQRHWQRLLRRDPASRAAELLRAETGNNFPEKVTAFRPEMAVHGKLGQPCPVCGAKVQRIRYADNETNYCPACQTGGKLLADRALSRLLKKDWPKTPEDSRGAAHLTCPQRVATVAS